MKVVVIGGGISGLACAYFLQRAGADVRLLESTKRFGGTLRSVQDNGFLFELGPQSFLSTDLIADLVRELDLAGNLAAGDRRAPRFVLLNGKLHIAPMAPPALLGTSLFGVRTKLRLFIEPFRRSVPPDGDESVADFVRRKFGDDLLENMVGPLVSGIYAGDPERLSLRASFPFVHEWESRFGSVIRGAIKSRPPKDKPRHGLCSFRSGVAALPERLAQALGDRTAHSVEVRTLLRRPGGEWELSVVARNMAETIEADTVVLATSADGAGKLLSGVSSQASEILRTIPYAAVAVVNHGFRREDVGHPLQGFGFLVPRKENLRVLGAVWTSSLFPGRAPEGMVSLASFVGGALSPDDALGDADEIAAAVEGEISPILGLRARPCKQIVAQYPRALPQYNLGHTARIAALQDVLAQLPGIHLAGNYLSGPSIGACIAQARQTATAVLRTHGAA